MASTSSRGWVALLAALGVGAVIGVTAAQWPFGPTAAPLPPMASPTWLKGVLEASGGFADRGYDFVGVADPRGQTSPTQGLHVFAASELTRNLPPCASPAKKGAACLIRLDPTSPEQAQRVWDRALLAGARAFATSAGDGFVKVRAEPEPKAIRAALARGDFYVSDGLELTRIEVTETALELEAASTAKGPLHFAFLGTGGQFLADARGTVGRFDLSYAPAGYVRAVVTAADGKKAWTQPVFLPTR
jgi:hypothetical protein